MGKRSWNRWGLPCALVALALTACGGGGGGNDVVSADLSGWWDVEHRPLGGPKPWEMFVVILADDTGSSFWANGTEFTRTGNLLRSEEPSATDPDREVIQLTIVNADLLEGTVERFESGSSFEITELRVTRRTVPTGTFTMTGTVAGQPASLSSTTAFGGLREGGSTSELCISHVEPYEHEMRLDVWADESPLQARTYTVGLGLGLITARARLPDDEEKATSGTVTFTAVGARLVGTYDLTMPGGAVTGSFDVDVLLPGIP